MHFATCSRSIAHSIVVFIFYYLHFGCVPVAAVPCSFACCGVRLCQAEPCVVVLCLGVCSSRLLEVDSRTFFFPGSQTGPGPPLIAVDSLPNNMLSVLKKKRASVCSRLLSFYLYFKPHTRCRVGRELVTGAPGCIIHERELLSRCCG